MGAKLEGRSANLNIAKVPECAQFQFKSADSADSSDIMVLGPRIRVPGVNP